MSAPASSAAAPRSIFICKTDTLGDLVLFAPTLQALRTSWPETKITLLVRSAYVDLGPLLAPPGAPSIEWLTTTLDPYAQGPAEVAAETARLRDQVTALAPDLFVAATSRRNWLEAALAASLPSVRRIALGTDDTDPFFTVQLKLHLGIDAAAAFDERIAVSPDEPDWQRGLRLADRLLGHSVPRIQPSITLPAEARAQAAAVLRERGLAPGAFVVCAAAGFANVAIKTWPAENFVAALRHLGERHHLPTLLIGHESERAYLESLRSLAASAPTSTAPALWLGGAGDLPLLAALIAESALFLGNDTGALHLAAAVDVPVVAIFGGGTWPRFAPAARRAISVVHPLPCFGCGWDCAFGDAPCVKVIAAEDVTAALDTLLPQRSAPSFSEIRSVQHVPADTQHLMAAAADRYRALQADHLSRQQQIEGKDRAIEEKEAAIAEKEAEITALKTVCDEREKLIVILDGHMRNFQSQTNTLTADKAILEKTLAALPAESADAAKALANQFIHIRNIESALKQRETEIAELRSSATNRAAGLHDLEYAKHYGRLLAEKEAVIQSLSRGLAEREKVIAQLSADSTHSTSDLYKFWVATSAHVREKWWRPFDEWLFKRVVEDYWMQIGVLRHYAPRALQWDRLPGPRRPEASLPQVAVVTPSYGQERFIERTLRSVLDQAYPKLVYAVQDGASRDRSPEIIARYAGRLRHSESVADRGQADAIHRGFGHIAAALGPEDIMAWLNSDDLLAPGSLRFVAEYFAAHPEVDVVYGHRIIIDDDDRDVGRWIMPRHNPETLQWIDYVPQETMFWRKRAWDLVGGIDPTYQFALDWDLLARFQQAGCRMVRVPYFLGAFRVHSEQKTSQAIHTTGADEMRRIRTRFHGERQDDAENIHRHARHARFWGAITARLHALGIRR
ncbi:MAG: glycosyltransferase family 9 protein [Verrucomicrobiota bacterium]